ncbi:MAG: hypothetical protein ABSD49_02775 [Candidatus Bathyarchaeia archaeon]
MVSRKLYQIIGLVCGFAVIDYGFNFIAIGLPGAREMTSQFVGANLLVGGSAAVFISLFYLLRSNQPSVEQAQPGIAPDVGIETIVEEETPPQYRFYKNIEYVGYFFAALGLFSAADLMLQVFVYQMYNEVRWWVEVLLVVFGVLAYAIFGSIGRIGAEEERTLSTAQPGMASPMTTAQTETQMTESASKIPETLELSLDQFSRSPDGEYEHKLTDYIYDMVGVRPEMVNVWREDRKGMRPVYLAGPYELGAELLEEHAKHGEPISIGILSLSTESVQALLSLQKQLQTQVPP